MRRVSSIEVWEFEKPFGEPDMEWDLLRWNEKYTAKERNTYFIERREDRDNIVWYGQGTNWKKEKGEGWKYLGEDESVLPYKEEEGAKYYPEGRTIWIGCPEPIYESLRKQYYENI